MGLREQLENATMYVEDEIMGEPVRIRRMTVSEANEYEKRSRRLNVAKDAMKAIPLILDLGEHYIEDCDDTGKWRPLFQNVDASFIESEGALWMRSSKPFSFAWWRQDWTASAVVDCREAVEVEVPEGVGEGALAEGRSVNVRAGADAGYVRVSLPAGRRRIEFQN